MASSLDKVAELVAHSLSPFASALESDDDELLAFDNVILTPHMAGSPRSNGLRDMEELITGLARVLSE